MKWPQRDRVEELTLPIFMYYHLNWENKSGITENILVNIHPCNVQKVNMISLTVYTKARGFFFSYKDVPTFRDFKGWERSFIQNNATCYQSNELNTQQQKQCVIRKVVFCLGRWRLVICCCKYVSIFKRTSDIFTIRSTVNAASL